MFLIQQLAPSTALAAVVALVFALGARWLRPNWARQLCFAAASGGSYAIGHAKLASWPKFPPVDSTHWLLYGSLGAIAFGVAFGVIKQRWIARILVTGVGSAGFALALLTPNLRSGGVSLTFTGFVVGFVAVSILATWAIEHCVRPQSSRIPLLSFLAAAGGASGALSLSGSMLLGQLAAILGLVTFVISAIGILRVPVAMSVAPILATIYAGLLLCGVAFAELPWTSLALLAVAPLVGFIGRRETTFRHDLLRAALALLPVAAAIVLAFRASPPMDYY
jgi:hypothetical protein